MAEQGLTKFEIMQRKMAEKQRQRELARKGGGASAGGKKPKKKRASAAGGDGGDDSEKGLTKFEIMQKRMAEKQRKREEAKKKGGKGGSTNISSSVASGSGSGSDEDQKSGGTHRKAMTTKINMNAVREIDAKNDSESEEEQRNEPYNRIGSRRETAKKNAKLRDARSQIEVFPSNARHTMDRQLEKGNAVIFYSRADGQYIPGVVDSIQKSGREIFYKLEKKYKSSFDPVAESKRLGKKVTMDDDPDRYRRTDKPALIKKDTYFTILTNEDFNIELRLALLRVLRDKMKVVLAKHKKRDAKKAKINKIVSQYGAGGGGNYAGDGDEPPPEPKKEKKPKMSKAKTSLKVGNSNSNNSSSSKGMKQKSLERASSNEKRDKKGKHLNIGSNDEKKGKHGGSRAKSTANLPSAEKLKEKERSMSKSKNDSSKDRKKSPRVSKRKSKDSTNESKTSGGKRKSKDSTNKSSGSSGSSSSKSKSSSSSKKSKKSKTDAFAHLLPDTDVSEWSMGDISKWLMYLSNTPFVPPDDEDSEADEYDEDELEVMAKKKAKLFDKYFQNFVAAQIDGEKLLKLNKKSLGKTCGVKNSTDRTLLHLAIRDLKSGKIGGGGDGAPSDSDNSGSSGSSKKKTVSFNTNSNDEKEEEEWKPLKKFNNKPAKMKKTVTVMNTVSHKDDRPMTARKEVALRVGGGGYKSKKSNSSRGPKRPVSARKDKGRSRAKRFNESDDEGSDESENIDSESGSDEDEEADQPLTYKMMNQDKKNGNTKPVNDSLSLTRKLGGWDSDSE